MRAFPIVRIVAGVFTLLANAAFGLFLILDYGRFGQADRPGPPRGPPGRFGQGVHPETYHGPAVLAVFSVTALAFFFILLTAIIEVITRHKPIAITQVRFELAWIGVVVFLQYSAAVVFTTMYWFVFDCTTSPQLETCRTTNMVIFISSLAIPFTTLCYFIFFLVVAARTAKREFHESVWRTPVRAVDWEGRRRTLVSGFDDARSIASFANKEEAIMTLKSQPSYATSRTTSSKPFNDNTLNLKLDMGYVTPPPPAAIPPSAEPGPVRGFAPRPLQMIQTIRQSLQGSPTGRSIRGSVTTRSDASVYSTDSPETAVRPMGIPRIIRTSASTMANSMQSPILALGKVKYFQATS